MAVPTRKGTLQLMAVMIIISIIGVFVSIIILYNEVLKEKKNYLKELSENQIGIIRSVFYETHDIKKVSELLSDQKKFNIVLGESGEFTIGYLKHDSVFFISTQQPVNLPNIGPIPYASNLAVPMKYALNKNTGFINGLDYHGKYVLAYCNYIPELQWGIVTKMDVWEVKEPFYKASLYAIIATLVIVITGTYIFRIISNPIVSKIIDNEGRNRNLFEYSAIPIMEVDFSLVKQYFDRLKNAGVLDFREYFEKNNQEISYLASLVSIIRLNQKSVKFFDMMTSAQYVKNLFSYFNEDSFKAFREVLITLAEGKTYFECEMPIRLRSEEVKYILQHLSVMPGKGDSLSNVFITMIDITERKNAEEQLEMHNKRLEILSNATTRLLVSKNPQMVVNKICVEVMKFLDCQVFFNYIVDKKAGKLNLNAYEGIPEQTASEIAWLDYGEAICGSVAMDKQRIIAENIQYKADQRTELVKSFGIKAYACHPLICKDVIIGTLSFGTRSRNNFSEDELSFMKAIADHVAIGINRMNDEVALLRSEEQYRKLVEISPYAVFINRNNSISFVNPAAVNLFGAEKKEQLLGKSPFEIFHPSVHDIVKNRIERVLDGKPVPIIEIKIIRLDGLVRDVEVTGSRFTDQDGLCIQVILRDITERKQAMAIRTRYQLISEFARDPLLLVDPYGKIIEANRAAVEFYGYTYQELLGLWIHDLRKENTETVDKQMNQAREKGILFETIHLKKDKTPVYVEVSSRSVVVDEHVMLLSVIRDITERKRADLTLREHAKMLEYAPVLVRNLKDEIIMWNNGLEKIYGLTGAEAVGKVYHHLLQTQFPEPLEDIFAKLYANGKWEGELQHKGKDGQPVLVLSSWILYRDEQQNPVAIIEVDKDITKRKKAEKELKDYQEKLMLALENGSIGVWEWDIITNKIEWDERMEQIFGIEKGSFGKTYKAFESYLMEEDIPHTRNAVKKALENDIHFETVYRIKLANGDIKFISAKALVNKNEDGKPVKMTGVCFDITAMKKDSERVLFKLHTELLCSNRELEQFAYIASHDLQEPLRMVSSFTQLLAQRYKDKLDQDAREFIQFAVDGASRMQTLINDLLAFSRIQTKGKEFTHVDTNEVLKRVIYNLSFPLRNKIIIND